MVTLRRNSTRTAGTIFELDSYAPIKLTIVSDCALTTLQGEYRQVFVSQLNQNKIVLFAFHDVVSNKTSARRLGLITGPLDLDLDVRRGHERDQVQKDRQCAAHERARGRNERCQAPLVHIHERRQVLCRLEQLARESLRARCVAVQVGS